MYLLVIQPLGHYSCLHLKDKLTEGELFTQGHTVRSRWIWVFTPGGLTSESVPTISWASQRVDPYCSTPPEGAIRKEETLWGSFSSEGFKSQGLCIIKGETI